MNDKGLIRAGNHIYRQCPDCGKLVKLTGFFKGVHLCLTDEEREARRGRHD